jgi:hypothetical protein
VSSRMSASVAAAEQRMPVDDMGGSFVQRWARVRERREEKRRPERERERGGNLLCVKENSRPLPRRPRAQ